MVKPSREPRLGAAPQPPEETVEHRGRLGLALLQRRANDGGQIAHVLGDEKVMFHEAFDAREAAAVVIAEPRRQHRLDVEGEPLLGAAGREMQMTARPPQKFLAALEQAEFRRGEQPRRDQLPRLADVIDIFADPEQRVEVAQASFAFLHIGFDEITRGAGPLHARIAFVELRGDEFARVGAHDFAVEALDQIVEQLPIAENEPRLQQRRADGHVGLGLAQTFGDGAGGVADLLPQIPHHIEHRLDDALAPGRLLIGQQKQEIDIGAGRQRAAPIAADRDERQALAERRLLRDVNMADHIMVKRVDDLVFKLRQKARAGQTAPARFEPRLGDGVALVERGAQHLHDPRAAGLRRRGAVAGLADALQHFRAQSDEIGAGRVERPEGAGRRDV